MVTNASDITIVLSGGSVNLNPNNSLGGDPSSTPITTSIVNNLFDDVTSEEAADGHQDYRCIYIFNDGDDPIYSVKLWIDSQTEGGSDITLGTQSADEFQRITLSSQVPTGGNFTISYQNQNVVSDYDSDIGVWATNLQDSLLALSDVFQDLTVTAQQAESQAIIFDIKFNGIDGSRNFDKFLLVANDLVPSGLVNIFISVMEEGAPINTVAPEIDVATTPPGGIEFFDVTEDSPIELPVLYPSDGFPLWIQRTTAPDTAALEQDQVIIRMRAESLGP